MEDVMLVILEDQKIEKHLLHNKTKLLLGRQSTDIIPDIGVKSLIAGRSHGNFIKFGQEWFYTDNGSINGTYHNNKKIKKGINGSITPIILSEGDSLRIDSGNFDNPDPRGVLILVTVGIVDDEWKSYSIKNKRSITIGSDINRCDIVLSEIGPKHLRIKYKKNNFYLSVCDAKQEVFLNNKKIIEDTLLREKDVIHIQNKFLIYSYGSILYNT